MTLHHRTAPSRPLCRRRFMAASAALGVAMLLPGAALAAAVRELEGSVRVNGKDATRKTRVRPGDVIETGPKSKLVFVVGQDAFLLREQSRLSLDKSKGGKGTVISGLRLLTGALLAAFAEGPRTIETATATAGIRGTGVYRSQRHRDLFLHLLWRGRVARQGGHRAQAGCVRLPHAEHDLRSDGRREDDGARPLQGPYRRRADHAGPPGGENPRRSSIATRSSRRPAEAGPAGRHAPGTGAAAVGTTA